MGVVHFPIRHLSLPLFLSLLSPLLPVLSAPSPEMIVVEEKSKNFHTLPLTRVIGPESIAFDPQGRGPYTGVSDGRVLRWDAQLRRWTQFAVPPRRRGVTAAMCTGSKDPAMETKCGRPLGLQFDQRSGVLYIADAYYGLLVVGPRGGLATAVATVAEGVPFNLTNGVDIDQETGMVYFTDSSSEFHRSDWIWAVLMGDSSGRFMSYNPRTKEVKVLLRGLEFPNGVAISADNSFVLVAESTKQRILRYWIKEGPGKAGGTWDVFADLGRYGYPDNVKRSPGGDLWVGVNTGRGKVFLGDQRETDVGLRRPSGERGGNQDDVVAMLFKPNGIVRVLLNDRMGGHALSEVEERNGTLYLGSVGAPFIGVYEIFRSV